MHVPESLGSQGFRITAFGVREWMAPGLVERPHGTDTWLVVQFRHAVEIGCEQGPVQAPAGSIVIWRPHAPHLLGSRARPWCHSWIHADGDEVRTLLTASELPLDRPFAVDEHRWLDHCILALHQEVRGEAAPDPVILRNHLHTFLRQVHRARLAAGSRPVARELLALREHLEATFSQEHSLAALARRLGCSVPHLCARFRRAFGTSPIAYVLDLRLSHARLLLSERSQTVLGVARAVGYDDYHHFSKLFHRRFGTWPSATRGG
jgi:AraC-like DNA-binding protein